MEVIVNRVDMGVICIINACSGRYSSCVNDVFNA